MKNKQLLVFGGSNSSNSINRIFANYVASQIHKKEIISLNLNDFQMPIYSEDIEEKAGIPNLAYSFLSNIKKSDAIVLSLAEHNGSYSTAFKNILDWVSRIDRNIFQNRPMLLLSTSNGERGGQLVLSAAKTYFPFLGADIKGSFSLPRFSEKFNRKTLQLEDVELVKEIKKMTQHFVEGLNNYESEN